MEWGYHGIQKFWIVGNGILMKERVKRGSCRGALNNTSTKGGRCVHESNELV